MHPFHPEKAPAVLFLASFATARASAQTAKIERSDSRSQRAPKRRTLGGGQPPYDAARYRKTLPGKARRGRNTAGIDSVRARQKAREFFPTPFFLDFVRKTGF